MRAPLPQGAWGGRAQTPSWRSPRSVLVRRKCWFDYCLRSTVTDAANCDAVLHIAEQYT